MIRGKKIKSKMLKLLLVGILALSLTVPVALSSASAKMMEVGTLSRHGFFEIPYTSLEDVLKEARSKHEEVANEGTTLLKNNGLLPLSSRDSGHNKITLFNSCPGLLNGLRDVGYDVYDASPQTNTNSGAEGTALNKGVDVNHFSTNALKAMEFHNDVAVVRIFRTAGEANDVSTGRSLRDTGRHNVVREEFGDITYIGEDGRITEWNKEDYEAGKLREAWANGKPKGWNHENLTPDEPLARYETKNDINARSTKPVRHALMLSHYEEELIEFAKSNFDSVVVVYDSITQFELWDLQNDPEIDAILHSGRMTTTSVNNPSLWAGRGVARVMCGDAAPSSKLISQWDRDMTADPTWQNFGDNFQMDSSTLYTYSDGTPTGAHPRHAVGGGPGLHGVDYEEGIYLGYKYYETYWAESKAGNTAVSPADADEWHRTHVCYPFGYGLTYADFSYEILNVRLVGDSVIEDNENIPASKFSSSEGSPADVKKIAVTVKVTNTDAYYGGKAVAELYMTAPYIMNGIEKAHVVLCGFEKTRYLNPGQSDSLTIMVNVQDFASFDYNDANGNGNKGYELDEGKYTFKLMSSSSERLSKEEGLYDEFSFNLTSTANLVLDDFSDNVITPLFSDENTRQYTIRDENIMAEGGTGMTILSRAAFDDTFPEAPKHSDLRLDDNYIDDYVRADLGYAAGYKRDRSDSGLTTPAGNYSAPSNPDAWYYKAEKGKYEYLDDPSDPWYITPETLTSLMENWSQVSQSVRDGDTVGAGAAKKLREMSGVRMYDDNGKINPSWTSFMNQLTYLELQILVSCGNSALARIDAIDKNQGAARDNTSVINNIYHWGDQPLLARTWNLDLCRDHGRITAQYAAFGNNCPTGWWSPGCNLQRSPFSGRNGDYYSQDALFAGLIISAVSDACEEYGLACWIKHFVLNDQETNRNAYSLFTWGDEQTFRENYFIYPQKAFQEGRAQGNMQSFSRIGGQIFAFSYEANTSLVRDQWGWTGVCVTDAFAGMKGIAYTVPEKPEFWFDAHKADKTGYDKDRTLDTTKNWVRNGTTSIDQLVRGAQGTPDSNMSRSSVWNGEAYVNTINVYDANTNRIAAANVKEVTTSTDILLTGSNPVSGRWLDTINNGHGGVYLEYEDNESKMTHMTVSARHQWYYVRMTAMRLLYEAANCRGNMNGMLINDSTNQLRNYHNTKADISLKQGVELETSVAITDPTSFEFEDGFSYSNSVVYSVVNGTLPAGLSLDRETGIISGIPLEAKGNNTEVVIECRVANYLYGNKQVTFTAAESGISISKTDGIVGQSFTTNITNTISDDSVVYTASGLPDGLSIRQGRIEGTPKYSGKYDVTITAAIGNRRYVSDFEISVTMDTLSSADKQQLDSDIADAKKAGTDAQSLANQNRNLIDEKHAGCGGAITAYSVITGFAIICILAVFLRFAKRKRDE